MIVKINKSVAPEAETIAPEKLKSGDPATTLWHAFTDQTDQFHVGHWASEPCEIRVSYSENELCVLTRGEVELTDIHGVKHNFAKGDAFVIPAGFEGLWKSITAVEKIYAIFEAAKE